MRYIRTNYACKSPSGEKEHTISWHKRTVGGGGRGGALEGRGFGGEVGWRGGRVKSDLEFFLMRRLKVRSGYPPETTTTIQKKQTKERW